MSVHKYHLIYDSNFLLQNLGKKISEHFALSLEPATEPDGRVGKASVPQS